MRGIRHLHALPTRGFRLAQQQWRMSSVGEIETPVTQENSVSFQAIHQLFQRIVQPVAQLADLFAITRIAIAVLTARMPPQISAHRMRYFSPIKHIPKIGFAGALPVSRKSTPARVRTLVKVMGAAPRTGPSIGGRQTHMALGAERRDTFAIILSQGGRRAGLGHRHRHPRRLGRSQADGELSPRRGAPPIRRPARPSRCFWLR